MLREWTPDDVLFLRANYGSQDDPWLAFRLERDLEDLQEKAASLVLRKDKRTFPGRKMPRWSVVEVALLREMYPESSNLSIARNLGRSVKSVTSKANALQLKKGDERLQTMGRENVVLRRSRRKAN